MMVPHPRPEKIHPPDPEHDLIWKKCLCRCDRRFEMRSSWLGEAPDPATVSLLEKPRDGGSRNYSDEATSRGRLGEAGRGGKDPPPEPPEGGQPCPHPDFRLLASRTGRGIEFCSLKPPVCGPSLQDTHAAPEEARLSGDRRPGGRWSLTDTQNRT